jgi:steroid 5-alpha reductase family enzyme
VLSEALTLTTIAAGVVVITMTLVWYASVRLRNAGIVDIAWSATFALLALIYATLGSGDLTRRFAAAAMMVVWSLRLATHLGRRVLGHIELEDGRYAALRSKWGASANRKMFFFFHFQGATNVLLSTPVLIASLNGAPGFAAIELAGMVLWFVAVTGESVADVQLRRFKADPDNHRKVCTDGLWRYSRHPNYFFEWLVWVAFFLFAMGSPWGWITAYCPLLMLWFLYKVTGIPATEEHSLSTRGDAYRRYQQTTSAFVPWFPRSPQ